MGAVSCAVARKGYGDHPAGMWRAHAPPSLQDRSQPERRARCAAPRPGVAHAPQVARPGFRVRAARFSRLLLNGMRILITNGDERAALATARTLVAAGYQVHVAASPLSSLAGLSRGVRSGGVRSEPLDHPAHYAAEVGAVARAQGLHGLSPVTEPSVEALLRHPP